MRLFYLFVFLLFTTFRTSAQIVNIPDENFKSFLVPYYDANSDGEIQLSEALNITELSLFNENLIKSIEGIRSMPNLKSLDCTFTGVDSADLSGLTNLESVIFFGGVLKSIKLDGLINLRDLYCGSNQLKKIDVSDLVMLERLAFEANQVDTICFGNNSKLFIFDGYRNRLSYLNLSNMPLLKLINCRRNVLKELVLENLPSVTHLSCDSNKLNRLSLEELPSLELLSCPNNQLEELDVSRNFELDWLDCNNNKLSVLNLKNGMMKGFANLHFDMNDSLRFVCADDFEVDRANSLVNQYGYSNCEVNTYCSFAPGGQSNAVNGKMSFDAAMNNCDSADVAVPYPSFFIYNHQDSGYFYGDSSGLFNLSLQDGLHTIVPQIANTNCFTVSPDTLVLEFPRDTGIDIVSFCLLPNVIKNDLEINVFALSQARPGFESIYRLIFQNNGSSILSGEIDFIFDSLAMTLNNTAPMYDEFMGDTITWSYTDLNPFEARSIDITFRLNSPMDIPPFTGGELLKFYASIFPLLNDESPNNNLFTLEQTVVNSYDPNDKACLQGRNIKPEMIGEYVHYMIRFENEGSAEAINIVVKDIIDTDRFDITTLVPLDGSHNFDTRIRNENVVEFIFQNINLPFDDANNDGYVTFKIKTLPTLALGDTLTNEAEIYFDFNFPIITEPAMTLISEEVGVGDVLPAEGHVAVYPNPIKGTLYLESEEGINSVDVLNIDGHIIRRVKSLGMQSALSIDLQNIASGIYFVKIQTQKGVYVQRVVVE